MARSLTQTKINSTYSTSPEPVSQQIYLTQFGLMAERHWREFRPTMVRELEAQGRLKEALFEAQETTLGRNGSAHTEAGNGARADDAAGPGSSMGDDPGEVYPPAAGRELKRLNTNNYRITAEDRLGEGSLKQKCRDNFAAIELVRKLDAEGRAATDEEGISSCCIFQAALGVSADELWKRLVQKRSQTHAVT
jgi:hypothetical protein